MTVAEIRKHAEDIAVMNGMQEYLGDIEASIALAELKRRDAEDAAHLAEMIEKTDYDMLCEAEAERDLDAYMHGGHSYTGGA